MLKILISMWNGYSNMHKKEQFLYSDTSTNKW
jgi:hypothetical protein